MLPLASPDNSCLCATSVFRNFIYTKLTTLFQVKNRFLQFLRLVMLRSRRGVQNGKMLSADFSGLLEKDLETAFLPSIE
jgi:urate oxidase